MTQRYRALFDSGELERRVTILADEYRSCTLCPHRCNVDRTAGVRGICRGGIMPRIASYNDHHGEEPPISGDRGSGTVFFSQCSGRCIFCQNFPISHLGTGTEVSVERLCEMMLELQARGCHNINLVTASHYLPSFLSALMIAIPQGLTIPIVYNSSGYERVEIIALLDGIIDIYLPDIKYADDMVARELSGFTGYVQANRAALHEMYRQVGNLTVDSNGIGVRGLIIRHLILPEGLAGTQTSLAWIGRELSPDLYISIMDQYFPAYHAISHPSLGRTITADEYDEAIEAFFASGLHNGWIQDHSEER